MKLRFKPLVTLLALVLLAKSFTALATSPAIYTLHFDNLATGPGALQKVYTTFTFTRFDPLLGTLQSIDLAFQFSGTVHGSATGVSQSSSMNSTITHWVFFDFVDLSDNVAIAGPSLSLTANIPSGAQNATILFGPSFQSTSFTVNLVSGDPRFDAWTSGQGNVSGQLAVYFSNTTMNAFGLQFFPGTESGKFSGSFSVMYNYAPVPEPDSLALIGVAVVLIGRLYYKKQTVARS